MCITNLDSNLDDGWNGYGNYSQIRVSATAKF